MASALLHVIINVIIKLNLASIATIPLSMHLYLQILDNLKGDGEGVYIILIKLTEMGTTRTIFFHFCKQGILLCLKVISAYYQFISSPFVHILLPYLVCVCVSLFLSWSQEENKKNASFSMACWNLHCIHLNHLVCLWNKIVLFSYLILIIMGLHFFENSKYIWIFKIPLNNTN